MTIDDNTFTVVEGIVSEYCKRINIQFEEGMMEWDESDKNHPEFGTYYASFFEDMLNTKRFHKGPSVSRSSYPDLNTLPDVVHETIKASMPYYEKLYQLRIQK